MLDWRAWSAGREEVAHMRDDPAAHLRHARRTADQRSLRLVQQGRLVVRTLGAGLPLPLVRASGAHPVALPAGDVSAVSLPAVELDHRGRALLAAVLAAPP